MNKEELKTLVNIDIFCRDNKIIKDIGKLFFEKLGVYPDKVFPELVVLPEKDIYRQGYKCTLDGVSFYLVRCWGWEGATAEIYQSVVTKISTSKKRFLRKDVFEEKTHEELHIVKRLADIII